MLDAWHLRQLSHHRNYKGILRTTYTKVVIGTNAESGRRPNNEGRDAREKSGKRRTRNSSLLTRTRTPTAVDTSDRSRWRKEEWEEKVKKKRWRASIEMLTHSQEFEESGSGILSWSSSPSQLFVL